ncbi:hypothetical protein PYW08_011903 [Mythimna loreyi]|uniref:Uncharacterized protein n=1 Tax=Mythimna loreyi TaxID=667449 RepID=A0ACC2QNC9_9NEOP|nr:hypothetical protein PYW08_011903 [Mythimna loreyi]
MCVTSPMSDQTYVPTSNDEMTENDADVSNTDGSQLSKKKRKVKKKSDIGRIRKVNKSAWIDSRRKRLKNQGLSYISRKGKAQSKKLILPACDSKCRLKCKEKISEDVMQCSNNVGLLAIGSDSGISWFVGVKESARDTLQRSVSDHVKSFTPVEL